MKLSKLIKKINKENAPPDGWKPEDKHQAASVKPQAASAIKGTHSKGKILKIERKT